MTKSRPYTINDEKVSFTITNNKFIGMGIENSTNIRNVQENHQDSTGMIFREKPLNEQAAQSSNMRSQPIQNDLKKGRNDKIELVSPSGKRIQVKYKKLNNYLNQGYKQI